MENHEKFRFLAGILLIISAITHVSQLFVYGIESHIIGASIFGVCYLILGILLLKLKKNQVINILGIILPIIGGSLGIGRLILFYVAASGELNFFIIFHVIVDIIVVPSCIYSYIGIKREKS
ncbi:MAG: hypothetical protein ACTSUL_02430 [Promethearchaeota archaeon]